MFTGLVQDIGTIKNIQKSKGLMRAAIAVNTLDVSHTDIGASIACDGCCLTVVKLNGQSFDVEISLETLDITNLDRWNEGRQINLEPSLKLGDELGGHMVSGHVDGLATFISSKQEGESYKLTFSVPDEYKFFIAPKGSITLDGISLTVNTVSDNQFTVNIIPHTWQYTTISDRKAGDQLNMEIDTIARYVARYAEHMMRNKND